MNSNAINTINSALNEYKLRHTPDERAHLQRLTRITTAALAALCLVTAALVTAAYMAHSLPLMLCAVPLVTTGLAGPGIMNWAMSGRFFEYKAFSKLQRIQTLCNESSERSKKVLARKIEDEVYEIDRHENSSKRAKSVMSFLGFYDIPHKIKVLGLAEEKHFRNLLENLRSSPVVDDSPAGKL